MNLPLGLVALSWAQLFLTSGLAAQASPSQSPDSTFLLQSNDPARRPSPFIGNGHLGMVVPALGLGPAPAYLTALFEEAPSDVPRIVVIPAWGALGLNNGSAWLGADSNPTTAVKDYRQTIDMRTGTALTSYGWGSGSRRMAVRAQTFLSRAAPSLAVARLDLKPEYTGRVGVRFALTGWPPPKRLALGTLRKADPSWEPNDIWYPGHMVVRSRQVTRTASGARLTMSSLPEGRSTLLAQALELSWPRELENATVRPTASGDTARVELTFDATQGRTYSFLQVSSVIASPTEANQVSRAGNEAQAGLKRGFQALAKENADAWARRWKTDIEIDGDPGLQRVVRSMLFYLLCSADSGTRLGIPPMGLSSAGYYGHIFWDSDTWMFPSLLLTHPDVAHSLVAFRARTLPAAQANARPTGSAARCTPGKPTSRATRPRPSSRCRTRARRSTSPATSPSPSGSTTWPPATPPGSRAKASRSSAQPPTSGSAAPPATRPAAATTSKRGLRVRRIDWRERRRLHQRGRPEEPGDRRAASRRLGTPADPRWIEVAGKLHLPYDSASEYYRTYEGAPDSTLGDVTPLLSYPARRRMSERAKRSQLEQAVRSLLAEGPGAMMGSTLLSVDAAELGDRALVDSLLPHSYQRWLQGPFLMLSETPTNDAVNFVTGAGGFLQQVIYGYTGLRWARRVWSLRSLRSCLRTLSGSCCATCSPEANGTT